MRKKRARMIETTEEAIKPEAIPESKLVIAGALVNSICPKFEHEQMTPESVVAAVSAAVEVPSDWLDAVREYLKNNKEESQTDSQDDKHECTGNDSGDDEESDEDSIETETQKVSRSIISRHLLHGGMEAHGFPSMTLKVASRRSTKGERISVKAQQVQTAIEMMGYSSSGVELFFIDESHWDIGKRTVHAWSPIGKKTYCKKAFQRTCITAITAMSSLGNMFADAVEGPVTAEIFEKFIRDLLNWYQKKAIPERCVFYLDNAPVHKKGHLKELFEASGHILVFGPPYSPEMNPIEFMFGIWKKKADEMIGTQRLTSSSVRQVLIRSFHAFDAPCVRNLVNHVFTEVYKRVFAGDDI